MSPATPARARVRDAQAWIELKSDDPEAVSALAVARKRLAAGHELMGLRRLRLIELHGPLPNRPRLERLLDASTQFYNPHKERCTVRTAARDAVPAPPGAHVVVVTERGAERRPAAEHWWRRETGKDIEVRDGVAWVLELAPGSRTDVSEFVEVRDRHHGLLCNPHSQEAWIASGRVPLPWIGPSAKERA